MVTFLLCWMVCDDASVDCAATPTPNANVIAAAVIQMSRAFTCVSFERGLGNAGANRTPEPSPARQNIPNCSFAASDMRSRVHGGSHTMSTVASVTPSTDFTAVST